MHTMGILLILMIIPFVNIIAIIILLIYTIILLGIVKKINTQLNNENLNKFRTNYIISFVIALIGIIVLIILFISFIGALLSTANQDEMYRIANFYSLLISIVGGIIFLIAAIFQYIAWQNLYFHTKLLR